MSRQECLLPKGELMRGRIFWAMLGFFLAFEVSAKELGRIKILTYNVFGVLVAPARKARMEKIGEEIAELNPDVIGFQEAFEARHRRALVESLERSGWGKAYEFYQKKWYGPGAWIVSRYPLLEVKMRFYPVNGTALDSDYYGKKGVAYARVKTPFGPLDFFTTHLIARYTGLYDRQGNLRENDWLKVDRLLQAEQAAWFIQNSNSGSGARSLVAVGDFNSPPALLEYKLFQELSGLNNVADETPIQNCSGELEDCKLSERIDHIFYQNYSGPSGFYLKPVRTELVFYHQVPTRAGKIKLSDHNGLLTEFAVLSADDPEAKISDRTRAGISLMAQAGSENFSGLKAQLSGGDNVIKDPVWKVFAVKTLDQFNQDQNREEKVVITLAKILTADQPLALDQGEVEQVRELLAP